MMENEKLKLTLIGLLDKFIQVCEANNLRYYLAYGSVIGAVRHGGIIPWDDDLDVHMMRDDYERLQKLPLSVWGDSYELTSWKLTPGNQYHFLKLEDKRTTVIEQLDPLYVGGVYLDIFPLDYTPKDESLFEQQNKEIEKIQEKYYVISIKHGCHYKGIVNFIKFCHRHKKYLHEHIQDQWDAIACRYNSEGSEACFDYHSYSDEFNKSMPLKWFGDGKIVKFEGREVLIPQNYDAYLTYIYGDYMTPPPEDKRGGHEFYYINANERLSNNELQSIVSQLAHETSFMFSLKDEIDYWGSTISGMFRRICKK